MCAGAGRTADTERMTYVTRAPSMRPCRRATALTAALPISMTAASMTMATAPVDDVSISPVRHAPQFDAIANIPVDEIQTLVTGAR